MITILDVENTTCKRDGKQHFDPFEAENELVMVGMLQVKVGMILQVIHLILYSV